MLRRLSLDLDQRDAAARERLFERRPYALPDVEQAVESRRLLPAPPPQRRRANDVIVGRRHRLDDHDLLAKERDDAPAAVEQVGRERQLVFTNERDDAIDLVVDL